MNTPSLLDTFCKACGDVHHIEAGQFPPGVLELLKFDNGLIWDKDLIDHCWRNQCEPPDYPGALADVRAAIRALEPKTVLTVGSMSPWIESTLPSMVTMTDLRPIRIESEKIKYAAPQVAYAAKYDAVIAYSSVEHFGLGRYGDELDSDADRKWMKMIRQCIAPAGRLLLAVPVGPVGKVDRCYHRIYGPKELATLIDGYRIASCTRGGQPFANAPHDKAAWMRDWQNQPLLTLEPV